MLRALSHVNDSQQHRESEDGLNCSVRIDVADIEIAVCSASGPSTLAEGRIIVGVILAGQR